MADDRPPDLEMAEESPPEVSDRVRLDNVTQNDTSTDPEPGFEDNFDPDVNDLNTTPREFVIPYSDSAPEFLNRTSTPMTSERQARTPGQAVTPDLDSGLYSGIPSSEDVPRADDVISNFDGPGQGGTRRKVQLSSTAEDLGKNLNWTSPERPATLKLMREFSLEDSDRVEKLSNMSPSFYCLTPSDELSLDDLDTPNSPESMDEVFSKILGPRLSRDFSQQPLAKRVPFTINVETREVVAMPVQAQVIPDNPVSSLNDSHRRLIPVENGITTFGSIQNEAARLEVTDHPLVPSNGIQATALPSDVSYHDVHLNIEERNPSVAYRSSSSLHYSSDIVPLEEVYTRDFRPEELRNGQHVASVYPRECHGWTGANLSPESMPVQLIQLQVSEQDYSSALKWLSRDIKISYHTVLYNKWLQVSLFSIIFITLWMLGFLLWHTGGLPDRIGIGLFFILAWFLMVVALVISRIIRNSLNKKTENTLAAVNDVLLRYNIVLGVEDKGAMACNRIILHFIYFEEGPCLERVLDNLNKGMHKKRKTFRAEKIVVDKVEPEIEIDESDLIMKRDMTDGQRQDLAKKLMLKYSSMYVKRLMMERMPRPSEPRHAGNLPCLCQFVDRHYFKVYDVMAMI